MLKTLGKYYGIDYKDIILPVSRAFIGLYGLFVYLKERTGKKQVLFTSMTCPSPVFACIYAGMTPVFVDISGQDFLMHPVKTIGKIQKHYKDLAAVVYIYLFGHATDDFLSIKSCAENHGVTVIEDAAQAFGASVKGELVGSIGDYGVLSFGYSKHIDAGGGGALLFNKETAGKKEVERIISGTRLYRQNKLLTMAYRKSFYTSRIQSLEDSRKLSSFGSFHETYKPLYFGEMTVDWLKIKQLLTVYIKTNQTRLRNHNAQKYFDSLSELTPFIWVPEIKTGYSVYRYSILVDTYRNAQRLSEYLRQKQIHCSNLYLPVSRFFENQNYDMALDCSRRVINLWVNNLVNDDYINHTNRTIKKFFTDER